MRIAIVIVCGCHAALPPPQAARYGGSFEVDGTRFTPTEARPEEITLALIDPRMPDRPLRFTPVLAEPVANQRGIVEQMITREVKVAFGDVVLDRTKCTRLDAIERVTHGHAFGSARFDCQLPEHVVGSVEFAGGAISGIAQLAGSLQLDAIAFVPDEIETDPDGVMFWDHHHPRVVFSLDHDVLHVTSTSERVASFEVPKSECRTLEVRRHDTGFVRIGTNQHTSWAGTIAIDCPRVNAALEMQ
jgi:hypothetical protein